MSDDGDWTMHSANVTGRPGIALNGAGRLEMVLENLGTDMLYMTQTQPGGDQWGNEGTTAPGGKQISSSTLARNSDGRLEIFSIVQAEDSALYHVWQGTPGQDDWSQWQSLTGVILDFRPVLNVDGVLEVFARGSDGELWHNWQAPGGWHGWAEIGGEIGINGFEVVALANGHVHLFTIRGDGTVWYRERTIVNGWGNWTQLPGTGLSVQLKVGVNKDGRLEVFSRAFNFLYHIWQENNSWSSWSQLGGTDTGIIDFCVNHDHNGALELFAVDMTDGHAKRIWQTPSRASGWSDWESLGKPINPVFHGFAYLNSAADVNGNLVLAGVDTSSNAWVRVVPPLPPG